MRPPEPDDVFFLPDLCEIRRVFAVVLIGELLAFVLVLAPLNDGAFWDDLALVSLFVQWVGLVSTALLCALRGRLGRLSDAWASALSLGVIVAMTALVSESAYRLDGAGYLEMSLTPSGHWAYLGRNLAVGGIIGALALRYFYVQHQWMRNLELESRARVQALQSRIRPHFLFNSMNTIASLTRSQPELAERVVEDLADLFRVSLGDARVATTLERELAVCRQYLGIEGLRLGVRLRVDWRLGDYPPHALLPALTLQPLVENAVYHGIEPAEHGGTVSVSVSAAGGRITVVISNPPPPPAGGGRGDGNRMAQANVRQRLDAYFGGSAQVRAGFEGGAYRVLLRFPVRTAMA